MSSSESSAELQQILDAQREAYLAEGAVSLETRLDRLERAVGLVKSHERQLVEALCDDFGHRSEHQSLLTDVAGSVGPLRHAQKHVRQWMRSEKRKAGPFPLNLSLIHI